MPRSLRLLLLLLPLLVPVGSLGVLLVSAWLIGSTARGRIFTGDPARLPPDAPEIGLVLGTSKRTAGGWANPHFENRIAAAARLYHAGRVKHLIVSGDNGTRGYNEPADMRAALVARGVPDSAITGDYAGFRTLDSMVRARKIFGQTRLTLITDPFHADRAVFLARHQGIDALAFASEPVELRYSLKTRVREYLADAKACLDIFILRTKPRFLGPPVELRVP